MKLTGYLFIALSVLLFVGCGPSEKEKMLSGMTALVEQVDQRYAEMTDEEWTSADARFEAYVNKFEELKNELTDNEKQRFNELVGQYAAIRTKRFGLDAKEWLENFSDQLGGFWREIENTTIDDIKEFFE